MRGSSLALVPAYLFLLVAGSRASASDEVLRTGQPVLGPEKRACEGSILSDAVEELCAFPGVTCPADLNKSACRPYERQVFAGTYVQPTAQSGQQWNGMGGSGELVADTLMCLMRDLSPTLGGPLTSQASINLGIGTLKATQEIGFRDFKRINPVFNGYRRIVFELPVVGRVDAITQNITLTKRSYGMYGTPRYAGDWEIKGAYGVNVLTESKWRDLTIKPPGFPVTTPVGVIDVQPEFSYKTRTSVIAHPFAATYTDVPNFLGGPRPVRYTDILGLDQGMGASTKQVFYQNMHLHNTGWVSQLGLGTRGTIADTSVFSAGGGIVQRPELDFSKSRSSAEAEPSINVAASATVKYPKSLAEILPAFIFEPPVSNLLIPPEAFISVTPKVEAGAGGQYLIGASEGSDHFPCCGEFKFGSKRFANASIATGMRVAASFNVEARLKILVRINAPWEIFGDGEQTLIDIDKKVPIPLMGDQVQAKGFAGGSWSTGHDFPETLDQITTLKGKSVVGPQATKAYIEQCYAPGSEPPVNTPQKTPTSSGDPKDLFGPDVLWPCNVCVTSQKYSYEGSNPKYPTPVTIPETLETIMKAEQAPTWKCDAVYKGGCMDLCRLDPATQKLNVARKPSQIASGLPFGHPERDFYLNCEPDAPVVK
jgi:hypothetical protein